MSYCDRLILSIVDMFMLFVLIISVSTELNLDKKSRWLLGALSGAILISLISYYVNNSPIAISINICVVFIILRRLTNYKLSKIIIIYSYCLSIVYAIQIIIALGMKYYTDNFNTQFVYGVIAQMLALVVVVVLSRFQKLRTAYQMLDENFASRIIVINAFVIFYLFVMKWYMDFTGFIESTIIIVLIITILFAINGVLIKNVVEKQKFEEKMSVYDMYLPVIEEMIDEMRRKQHDYHNHLQALQGLLTQDGVNYRNNLVKNITWEKLIVLDNKVLMAFLFSKYTLALKKGVTINYKLRSTVSCVKCSDFDLIEMIGILVDNAIEATQDLIEPEFDLIIDTINGDTIIETRNRTEYLTSNDIKRMFEKDSSTKNSENRGVGLYKLQRLLGKGKGTIAARYDTDTSLLIFTMNIL